MTENGLPDYASVGEPDDAGCIAGAITLPADIWDALTEHLADKLREEIGDPHARDLSLAERIRLFLDYAADDWNAALKARSEPFEWGDELPF